MRFRTKLSQARGNEAYLDPIQVPTELVTSAPQKKFKEVLNGLIQATWTQSNS